MIRISEIKLTLAQAEHAEAALQSGRGRAAGPEIRRHRPGRGVQAQLRRAQGRAAGGVHRGPDARRRRARGRACSPASRGTRTSARRPTWTGARPVQVTRGRCPSGRWWSASAPAASSPRWCWRRWACARSCWSAARRCASAPRTPGACGASASSTPRATCSSAKAAPARSPTASSTARSRTRATSAAR